MNKSERLRSLDLLRAVAVFLVLGRHMEFQQGGSTWLGSVVEIWKRGGWIGVDLFFVLSGFLVSGLLFREYRERGSVNVIRFLVRRGLKIYPSFYFLIAATVVTLVLLGHPMSPLQLFGELLFLQNYTHNFWGHTWSLAVEEHFYLLLAAVVDLTPKNWT